MCKKKNAKCYNCRFASRGFKVLGKTHHHCFEPTQYPPKDMSEYKISPWDTLREWWDKCEYHEPLNGERYVDTIEVVNPESPVLDSGDDLPF